MKRTLAGAVVVACVVNSGYCSEPMDRADKETIVIYDPLFLGHDTGPGFPESPERLRWLLPEIPAEIAKISPDKNIDPLPWILTVHEKDYVNEVRKACTAGEEHLGSSDSPISRDSYDVAVRAVGATLTAVDSVMLGRARNAFAAVRPPGHHAMPGAAKGFCIFGNAAIAARYAQKKHGIEHVMIIDWDVHHGDGTQEIFYDDPSVFFLSVHQYPFYPGPSGAAENTGVGKGKGFTKNVPLAADSGDQAVLAAFRSELTKAFRKFKPELVIISAGFDAHEADPLGGLGWTSGVYGELTRIVRGLAREQGHERIVSVLEGGYSKCGLTEGVRTHLEALAE